MLKKRCFVCNSLDVDYWVTEYLTEMETIIAGYSEVLEFRCRSCDNTWVEYH